MIELAALAGLFVAAFGAATLLPFQSEIVFAALALREEGSPLWVLVAVASTGNTLGSVVNWVLGRWIERFRNKRWFPASAEQLQRAQDWYARWGWPVLLLSWAPFGDAITVAAGLMRTPLPLFLAVVGLAKTARYIALAAFF